MKVDVVESEKNKLVIEFDKMDQGLLNAINDVIWQQKGIDQAGFRIEHPEVGKPVFVLKTMGADPKKVWNSAVDELSKQFDDFASQLKKL